MSFSNEIFHTKTTKTKEITTKPTSSNTDFLSLSFKLTLELEMLLITQKIAKEPTEMIIRRIFIIKHLYCTNNQ